MTSMQLYAEKDCCSEFCCLRKKKKKEKYKIYRLDILKEFV